MDKKLVVIPSNGHIIPLGGILGPVVEPHVQPLKVISVLLMQNYKVSEVLNDGTHLPLDLKNFDKDNNAVKEEAPVAPPKEDGDKAPAGDDKEVGSVDVDKQPEGKQQNQQQQQNKQHHDKKKNKGLQADQTQPK